MKLAVTNITTGPLQDDSRLSDHRQWLIAALSYNVESNRGKPRRESFYSTATDSFPTGLLPFVLEKMHLAHIEAELLDVRRALAAPDFSMNLAWLRDYQREAFDACLSGVRGIVSMATGSGKGAIMAALVSVMPCDVLVITPGVTLLHQFAEKLREYTGIACGKVGDGHEDYAARVVVGTPESVYAHVRALDVARFGVVIVDEVHTLGTADLQSVLRRCEKAYYRFGFSATPLSRTDRRDAMTVGHLGPVLYSLPVAEAVRRGIVAAPTVSMIRFTSPVAPMLSAAAQWAEMHDAMISENRHRTAVVARWLRDADKPALVFVKETSHVATMQAELTRLGVSNNRVIGSMGRKQRAAAVNLLTLGAVQVMVATAAFRQAVDIPGLRSVGNAGGGESAIDVIQKIGRGTRKIAGKDTVRVMDVLDEGCIYCARGYLHPACRAVAKHAARRRHHYLAAGFMVTEDACVTPP